jgi:UDP-galactopyranose mutase
LYDYLIVGTGFSGSVLAERLASKANKKIIIVDRRSHIGGNAFDFYNADGILLHKYGPHWFHTNSEKVYNYLSLFTRWITHKHIIKSSVDGKILPFPINRNTLNQFYNINLRDEDETGQFLEKTREKIKSPKNAEEMVLSLVGRNLYEKFYLNYTLKQWDLHPKDLDASVTARIPIRFGTDESYFNDKFQLMPREGYTKLFKEMLCNRNITVVLQKDYRAIVNEVKFKKMIYTGPVDEFFNYKFGELPYRSLKFEHETIEIEYYQECQQINFPNENPFTRIVEWKHATGQRSDKTSIMKEYPMAFKKGDERFYPVPGNVSKVAFKKYQAEANKLRDVIFCGRLAEYKYYNMDQVIARALKLFEELVSK